MTRQLKGYRIEEINEIPCASGQIENVYGSEDGLRITNPGLRRRYDHSINLKQYHTQGMQNAQWSLLTTCDHSRDDMMKHKKK
jgi:hypothetical protein